MPNFKIEVDNIELVSARIKKLKGYETAIRPCLSKSLAEMKNRSNTITPKDKGELRASAFGRIVNTLEAEFGFSKKYAPFVELGHRIVIHGRCVGFQPANPYLEPNAEQQQDIFARDVENAMGRLTK